MPDAESYVPARSEDTVAIAQAAPRPGNQLSGQALRVLLVHDDLAQAEALGLAARESALDVALEVVTGVEAAVAALVETASPEQPDGPPDVIVAALSVDENHRLLAAIHDADRSSAASSIVPVVVLTHSATPEDERRSFELGASGHLRTPEAGYEMVALMHALPEFVPRARLRSPAAGAS